MILEGRVWKLGDGVSATDLVPARYDKAGMQRDWEECARHVLEDVEPNFVSSVRPGDILVAGENLGAGHAHYYSAGIMGGARAGLAALLADSVNALFQRAAIDAGVPTWSFAGITALVETGERLRIDLRTGEAGNLDTEVMAQFAPVSPIILDIIGAGGSRPWALGRLRAAEVAP